MSIPHWWEKINSEGVFVTLLVILVGSFGFGLGRLSKIEERRRPVQVEIPPVDNSMLPQETREKTGGQIASPAGAKVIASKKGSKYHLPWCSGVKSIKEENKIWFDSPGLARRAGYTPAANCPGIK